MRAFPARHFGTCPLCAEKIVPGHPIIRAASVDGSDDQERYEHVWCAQHVRNKQRIASGVTFAARKPKDWRRG